MDCVGGIPPVSERKILDDGTYEYDYCEDGMDNDCDGLTDRNDPDCEEAGYLDCFDNIDNDKDGWVDFCDVSCLNKRAKLEISDDVEEFVYTNPYKACDGNIWHCIVVYEPQTSYEEWLIPHQYVKQYNFTTTLEEGYCNFMANIDVAYIEYYAKSMGGHYLKCKNSMGSREINIFVPCIGSRISYEDSEDED